MTDPADRPGTARADLQLPPRATDSVRAHPEVRRRSEVEIRWRQFRHAPRPIVRAVLSSLIVAIVLDLGYLAYDVALRRGAVLPGGDLRVLFLVLDIAIVLIVGSVVTWWVVPQPRGSGQSTTHSPWSAALGFFAAVPVCYLVLVVVVQVLEPMLG
ncbi:MAG TPA: hypothetical protein VHS36_04970 [Candidatus Limnocylindrales bacterium]|nr:hypothetical protein [Candidatus Limnocylindrales bacterium]